MERRTESDGEKCPIAVLYGGERISENNGVYACVLKEGDNEFEFVAGSGSLTYVKKASVYLGKFRLNTNLKSMHTDRNVAEFKAIAVRQYRRKRKKFLQKN